MNDALTDSFEKPTLFARDMNSSRTVKFAETIITETIEEAAYLTVFDVRSFHFPQSYTV